MLKVMFLDLDSVPSTDSYQASLSLQGKSGWDDYGQLFDPEAVGNLKMILVPFRISR